MNFINECVRLFNINESIFVNIENIIISTFIFVIKHSDQNFFLIVFFSALFI